MLPLSQILLMFENGTLFFWPLTLLFDPWKWLMFLIGYHHLINGGGGAVGCVGGGVGSSGGDHVGNADVPENIQK